MLDLSGQPKQDYRNGEQLEIDLSDKAIAKMLAAQLLPRFHALLTAAE